MKTTKRIPGCRTTARARRIAEIAGVVTSLALPLACTNVGTVINQSQVDAIRVGEETKAQIGATFGVPMSVTQLAANPAGCVERWMWLHGRFYGSMNSIWTLTVDFNDKGIVCDRTLAHSGTGLK